MLINNDLVLTLKKKETLILIIKYIHTCNLSLWKNKHSTKGIIIIINIRKVKKKTNNYYHELYSNIVNIYLNTNNVII